MQLQLQIAVTDAKTNQQKLYFKFECRAKKRQRKGGVDLGGGRAREYE